MKNIFQSFIRVFRRTKASDKTTGNGDSTSNGSTNTESTNTEPFVLSFRNFVGDDDDGRIHDSFQDSQTSSTQTSPTLDSHISLSTSSAALSTSPTVVQSSTVHVVQSSTVHVVQSSTVHVVQSSTVQQSRSNRIVDSSPNLDTEESSSESAKCSYDWSDAVEENIEELAMVLDVETTAQMSLEKYESSISSVPPPDHEEDLYHLYDVTDHSKTQMMSNNDMYSMQQMIPGASMRISGNTSANLAPVYSLQSTGMTQIGSSYDFMDTLNGYDHDEPPDDMNEFVVHARIPPQHMFGKSTS